MIHKLDYNYLMHAHEVSKKSDMLNNHGCIIVDKKGHIIASGYNKILFVPKDKNKIFNKYNHVKISKHAEEVALKKVDPKKLKGAKLYIVRACLSSINDLFMFSKPCNRCMSIIQTCVDKHGLKNVYYSINGTEISKLF